MVRHGSALAYREYSTASYADGEVAIEAEHLGLWRGDFVPSWDWRRGERPAQPAGCRIKGNISNDGERIYHVPGRPGTTGRRLAQKGERWWRRRGRPAGDIRGSEDLRPRRAMFIFGYPDGKSLMIG